MRKEHTMMQQLDGADNDICEDSDATIQKEVTKAALDSKAAASDHDLKCNQCNYKAICEADLNKHIDEEHYTKIPCPMSDCEDTFNSDKDIEKHMFCYHGACIVC